MSTLTPEEHTKIAEFLDGFYLTNGVGSEEAACSVAAINLALTGQLTDEIPSCMSRIVGLWIIGIQDAMPEDLRNAPEWRTLLPLAAGTGRDHEPERMRVIMDWLWDVVLPQVQSYADGNGFGDSWRRMCEVRTSAAAFAAGKAAAEAPAVALADAAIDRFGFASVAANDTAEAVIWAAKAVARWEFWTAVNPAAVLAKMVEDY